MLVAGVLCLCAAAASAALGARALIRPASSVVATQRVLRTVAPTQLAAAVMLAAGGAVALSARPSIALLTLCIAGALGTVAAGAWQSARYAGTMLAAPTCQRDGEHRCASCTLSTRTSCG
ncbi:MAG TPA: hypothetical protein VFB19_11685 [Mycobacterium sp.]|nr:hypothetical protein [Mycobacterium sp.]